MTMRDFRAKKTEVIISEIRYASHMIPDLIAGLGLFGLVFVISILMTALG